MEPISDTTKVTKNLRLDRPGPKVKPSTIIHPKEWLLMTWIYYIHRSVPHSTHIKEAFSCIYMGIKTETHS